MCAKLVSERAYANSPTVTAFSSTTKRGTVACTMPVRGSVVRGRFGIRICVPPRIGSRQVNSAPAVTAENCTNWKKLKRSEPSSASSSLPKSAGLDWIDLADFANFSGCFKFAECIVDTGLKTRYTCNDDPDLDSNAYGIYTWVVLGLCVETIFCGPTPHFHKRVKS